MAIWSEVLTCLFVLVYGSFFEWFVHRHFMHARRFPLRDAYRGHTIVHHTVYRGDATFEAPGPGHPSDVLMRWSAFPAILLFHLPFFFLFQWLTGLPTVLGGVAAVVIYFGGYEYTHYLMHVPSGHRVERFRWFRFLREHHRLHHKYVRRNFNVFFPLADLCLRTLITTEDWRSRPPGRPSAGARKQG